MPDIEPEDALQVAQRALSKVNELERELETLREEYDETVEEQVALALRLSEHDEDRAYDDLQRDDRIGIVRQHAYERATGQGGRAALDYKDVKYGAFDGEPSPSYCYDLMRWACGFDVDAHHDLDAGVHGFAIRDPDGGNRELVVDADRAKAQRDLFSAKKDARGEGVI